MKNLIAKRFALSRENFCHVSPSLVFRARFTGDTPQLASPKKPSYLRSGIAAESVSLYVRMKY
jgi:hypothetical protein